MSLIFTEEIKLETIVCGGCGITYAVPEKWIAAKRSEAGSFTCPNGCNRGYHKSDADRLREQLVEKEKAITAAKCETLAERHKREQAEEKQLNAERKLRRSERGVCTCCNRTFRNLSRHMQSKHGIKNGHHEKK